MSAMIQEGPNQPGPAPALPDMSSMASRMGRMYRILRRVHGVYVVPLFLAVMFLCLRRTVGTFMALDHLSSRFRKTRASRPIVIVGNPRTGTTFLQRFMAAEGFGSGTEL